MTSNHGYDPGYDLPARINPPDRQLCNHGDLFMPGDYRFAGAQVACWDPDAHKMMFIDNPDDSEAGYLTIPACILSIVTDSVGKYKCLWEQPCDCNVNMHVSTNDKFVLDKFGEVSDGWKFDVWYAHGELEKVFVTPPDGSAGAEFEPDADWQTIVSFFDGRKGDQKRFQVHVQLDNDDLAKYKDKYTTGGKKFSWVSAAPVLVSSWRLERGASSMGQNSHKFTWKLEGPAEVETEVIEKVKDFLTGFQYKFVLE